MTSNDLITRDHLAIERTKLANERTYLAYFRTFITLLSGGVAVVKMEFFSELRDFGIILIVISPFILLIGTIRLIYVRRKIRKFYRDNSPD